MSIKDVLHDRQTTTKSRIRLANRGQFLNMVNDLFTTYVTFRLTTPSAIKPLSLKLFTISILSKPGMLPRSFGT